MEKVKMMRELVLYTPSIPELDGIRLWPDRTPYWADFASWNILNAVLLFILFLKLTFIVPGRVDR